MAAFLSSPSLPLLLPRGGAAGPSRPRLAVRAQAQEQEQGDGDFEARLSKLQRKVTSGSGKKAEVRKARKEGAGAGGVGGAGASRKEASAIFLPPVELREAKSGGLPVQLGFNSYSERLNGRFAGVGLAALLLVELATGSSCIKFHDPSTIFLQLYFTLSVAAIFIKVDKERISVWPK